MLTKLTAQYLRLYRILYKGLPPIILDGKTLDRDTQLLLHMSRTLPDLSANGIKMARRRVDLLAKLLGKVHLPTPLEVKNESLPMGGNDKDVKVRRYKTSSAECSHTLLYFHGGGFSVGSLNSHDSLCRILAAYGGVEVVSIDYPLAPESPYPAALETAISAYEYFLKKQPAESILMGGDSAGAHLTIETLLYLKKQSIPLPKMQLLIYPATAGERDLTGSIESFGKDYFLTVETMLWFHEFYNAPEHLDFFKDLEGLSPALVVTAGYDPLLDEGIRFQQALKDHGVQCQHINFPGLIHGFTQMMGVVKEARSAIEHVGQEVRSLLDTK